MEQGIFPLYFIGKEGNMRKIVLVFVLAILASMAAYPVYGADPAQEEINKKNVVEFYKAMINQKDFEAASKYVGSRYVQHNPMGADHLEGIKNFIQFLREKMPDAHWELKRVFADGDYVITHGHTVSKPGDRGMAAMDIFRLEEGKIVEHWDAVQPIPEKAMNANTMF
jgi:predicted SnoaL-like aldol condensation-catalyzing enzyme